MIPNEINVLCYLPPENGNGKFVHVQDTVYGINGVCRTLCYRDHKDPIRIVVFEDDEKIQTNSIHSSR